MTLTSKEKKKVGCVPDTSAVVFKITGWVMKVMFKDLKRTENQA